VIGVKRHFGGVFAAPYNPEGARPLLHSSPGPDVFLAAGVYGEAHVAPNPKPLWFYAGTHGKTRLVFAGACFDVSGQKALLFHWRPFSQDLPHSFHVFLRWTGFLFWVGGR